MDKCIVVDVPHDGTQGYDLMQDELRVSEAELSIGRDFGAREIFLGHEWALHEVVGESYRDLMDLNRLPFSSGADQQIKTHGMSLDGKREGHYLWKQFPPQNLGRLAGFASRYYLAWEQALIDSRTKFVVFGHTMLPKPKGSSTSLVPAGQFNALASIGNGGDAQGEGPELRLPTDHAQFFKTAIEAALSAEFDTDFLRQFTGENGVLVALNDYPGEASADRHPLTKSRQKRSVLIEFNRGLISHPEDPVRRILKNRAGDNLIVQDCRQILHDITDRVMRAYQQRYL